MKTDKKMAPVLSVDGNEAAARVAHKLSEVVAIYPITPASSMGELADQWSAAGEKNIWGEVPGIVELQSEGGAAGAVHGALQSGALTTTFTASQGLLLMLPNMFKIAGELTPTVFHIAARSVATHALSIFGDHSDIMAARATGFAMLGSNSVQEAQDMALVAHAATLASRVPFLHFFDGFRTSHEIQKILGLTDSQISAMIDPAWIAAHRKRRLTPDSPFIRGTAQNPDVFFQAREACNPYYLACPAIVEDMMDKFYEIVGRRYNLFEYLGDPEADRVMVMMGSGAEAAGEAVKALNAQGEKVGLLKVRLYRPFSAKHFLNALPATVKAIAVMDRTKEPGAQGEPLYTDIATTILEYASREDWHLAGIPKVVGGRYGLSSKAFTPAMAKAILDELKAPQPRNHFTIGIKDDVTHTSLAYDPSFSTENPETFRGLFYGLGSDGTVSANKNAIKIIGQETDQYAQGYFVYDSKKAGSVTVSHLRFGKDPITATYLVEKANFIAVHHHNFLEKFDLLENADPGAVFLLNSPVGAKDIWQQLPAPARRQIVAKKLKFYLIDAYEVAKQEGMGRRINTIMQTCFFAISGILPREEAIRHIKNAIKKTYGKKGEELIKKNFAVVDATLSHLKEVDYPLDGTNIGELPNPISPAAPEF
ncbi:MAG: pyruvate:ferredoxin (flavodoxin) oxidoreductase, partial [Calditrichaeota bacterium]|nr:pyruvate:ferredoxin (flavodoxin) oxidoreductase [Calditrichota bacterium]